MYQCPKLEPAYPGRCLLYTSDAADERSSVDLGGRRIIKKKNNTTHNSACTRYQEKQNKRIHTLNN